MKNTKQPHVFNYKNQGEKVILLTANYADNGRLAVIAVSENGAPYAGITVNIPEAPIISVKQAYIDAPNLDYDGVSILEWLVKEGLVTDTHVRGSSGFNACAYPLVEFTDKFFELCERCE
jgi:hypothetical protein